MLCESHHEMLAIQSGLSERVIQARGYETIDTKAKLKSLGFSDRQSRVPALLIPILDVQIISLSPRSTSNREGETA